VCVWHVSEGYLEKALYQLEENGVKPEYIHVANSIENSKYLLLTYRTPPYEK